MYKSIAGICVIFFLLVSSVEAAVIVRTANQLEVAEGVIDGGELLAVGLPVTLSNEVLQDATLLGNRVKVNAAVGGDLFGAGFFVDVDAPVADDVRIVGGEVNISNAISGDLIVLGGSVELLSTGSVGGDVVVYGGSVQLSGEIGGDIVGAPRYLTINGAVGGKVDVSVMELELGNTASITESVRYVSGNLVNQALNATVGGDVVRNDPVLPVDTSTVMSSVIVFLIVLFTSLVWYLLSGKSLAAVTSTVAAYPVRSAAIGVSFVCLSPLVIVILLISQLGMYVAAVYACTYVALLLFALAAVPAVVGQFLLQLFSQPTKLSPVGISIGSLAVVGSLFVPVVGMVLVGIVAVVAAGGIIESIIKANR